MLLHKTDKARTALQQRPRDLSLLDRRILILSDGRRDLGEIVGLLGDDSHRAALRLVEQHYLSTTAIGRRRAAAPPAAAAADAVVPERAATPAAVTQTAPATSAPRTARRSLAATKMYMLDMLQLQRDPESAELRMALQTCVGEEALVATLLRSVQFVQRVAPASYALRVYQRVEEVLPPEALPALRAQCAPPPMTATG